MNWPVRCRWCNGVYDLAMVEVIGRYADCSTWKAPCCGVHVDDRGWKSAPDYYQIPPGESAARTVWGRP